MKHRRLLDAVIVGALLLAHVPGLTEELPMDWQHTPAALMACTADETSAPVPEKTERPDHTV